MSEEKTNEESEDTTPTEDAGNKPTTTPLIDIANAAAERMEEANKETGRLQEVQAERDARIALGGRSGGAVEPVKKEVDSEQYAKDVLSGKIKDDKKE